MWLGIIWNLLKGNLSGIVSSITGYLGKVNDNDTTKLTKAMKADKEVAIAQLNTSATIYHERAQLLSGLGVTQYLIAAALIPPIYHMGGVFLDSCHMILFWEHKVGSWQFIALPKPYDQYEWLLVSSLLGIQSAATVGLGFAKALMRR